MALTVSNNNNWYLLTPFFFVDRLPLWGTKGFSVLYKENTSTHGQELGGNREAGSSSADCPTYCAMVAYLALRNSTSKMLLSWVYAKSVCVLRLLISLLYLSLDCGYEMWVERDEQRGPAGFKSGVNCTNGTCRACLHIHANVGSILFHTHRDTYKLK